MKKNIDIFLSVVDNYGDMGFLTEILFAFQKREKDAFVFSIWTDAADAISSFLQKNTHILPEYHIFPFDTFEKSSHPRFVLSLFHCTLISFDKISLHSIVLRIDYISFDRSWCHFHETEHIESHPLRKVIEIIPAPFHDIGGGILPVSIDPSIVDSLCEKYSLDRTRRIISIFCYKNTLDRIDFSLVPKDATIYILGHNSTDTIQKIDSHIFSLPFLRLDEFHAFLSICDWSMIRGEVSLANALSLGKPFLWDMYKEIGGFHRDQNDDFLQTFHFSHEYTSLHARLNTQNESSINLIEVDKILMHEAVFHAGKNRPIKNLFTEIKKYCKTNN